MLSFPSARPARLRGMVAHLLSMTTVIGLLGGLATVPAHAAGTPPILSVSDTTTYGAGHTPIVVAPTLTITDDDTETLDGARVNVDTNFDAATDRLGISGQGTATSGTVSGLSWSYTTMTGVLTISGDATTATYQSVLRQVTFYTTGNPTLNTRTVQFTLGSSLANPDNGHFYEFISQSGVSWSTGRDAAAGSSLFGLQGYLATITSDAETGFIRSKVAGNGWIGASDAASEGDWRWVTGPEAGTAFWLGNTTGAPVNGQYNHWSTGEPNNSGDEDYAHVLGNPAFGQWVGYWNDLPNAGGTGNYVALGYLVEYGGMPGDPTLQITDSATVQVVDGTAPASPTITGPANGSTTSNPSPPISGTAEPGSTVVVKEGDIVICTATTDANGNWSCTPTTPLSDGQHTITATATDDAGNTSPAASSTFTVDTTAPAVPIINGPSNGSKTANQRPPINGTAEPGTTVTVKEGNTVICTAVVDAAGRWSCTPSSNLSYGQHTITATSVDEAGNTSPAATTTFRVYNSLVYVPMTGYYGYPEAPAVR